MPPRHRRPERAMDDRELAIDFCGRRTIRKELG
jgi:hypothetical protein